MENITDIGLNVKELKATLSELIKNFRNIVAKNNDVRSQLKNSLTYWRDPQSEEFSNLINELITLTDDMLERGDKSCHALDNFIIEVEGIGF